MTMLDDQTVRRRRAVIDALAPPGAMFEYVSADAFAVACPICAEPLRATFQGELVELFCTAGCTEHDVVRAAFGIEAA